MGTWRTVIPATDVRWFGHGAVRFLPDATGESKNPCGCINSSLGRTICTGKATNDCVYRTMGGRVASSGRANRLPRVYQAEQTMAALAAPVYMSCFGNSTLPTQPWPNQDGSLQANHRCDCTNSPRPSDQWSVVPRTVTNPPPQSPPPTLPAGT